MVNPERYDITAKAGGEDQPNPDQLLSCCANFWQIAFSSLS
jgi:hypothetical protein